MILNKILYLFFVLLVLIICVVSSSHNPSKQHDNPSEHQPCKKHCPLKQRWICGFDGTNYRLFANKCWMDKFNCAKKSEYNHVERKLCQKAHQEYHRSMTAGHHNKSAKFDNKCVKCNAGYKPTCGYNGETNQMFKNSCHLKRFNCLHADKKFQVTQLNNCPIPIIEKIQESKSGNKKSKDVTGSKETAIKPQQN